MGPSDFAWRICSWHGAAPALLLLRVGLEAQASLIVAASDLKVVRLLRDAIRTADIASGKFGPLGTLPGCAREKVHPTPRFESRPVHHPDPRIEPRQTIHLRDRVELQPHPTPVEPEQPVRCRSPIKPVWRTMPTENAIEPRPIIKLIVQRPDIVSKGSLIDFFI